MKKTDWIWLILGGLLLFLTGLLPAAEPEKPQAKFAARTAGQAQTATTSRLDQLASRQVFKGAIPDLQSTPTMKITSTAFRSGTPIPDQFSAYHQNSSPRLTWSLPPEKTESLVLIMEDPDVPRGGIFTHWIIYNIPADTKELPEGISDHVQPESPAGAIQGRNSAKQIGYFGPRPPKGDRPHRYYLQVFALDTQFPVVDGIERKELMEEMRHHVIGWGELIGTYQAR